MKPASRSDRQTRNSSHRAKECDCRLSGSTMTGSILTISAFEEDHIRVREILGDSISIARKACTCRQAMAGIHAEKISLLICDADLPDGTWRDVFSALGAESTPPLLIVASRLADEHLWAEVLNLGGHDVLSKPFDPKEVLWVVHHALSLPEQKLANAGAQTQAAVA